MNQLMSPALILLLAATALGESEGGANVGAGTVLQSIAAIVVFFLLFAVLRKFAWGPILKGLQDRENKIRHDLEHAEQAAQQAAATLKEYQSSLAKAQEEARKIIEQSKADAQRVADQVKSDTQGELTAMKQRAERDLRVAKEQALTEIYTQTAVLATDVAGKILRREIRPEDQQKLVQESLTEMGKTANN